MPKISQKGLSMPASPIRKLVPYAEIAKAKGRKIYHLNIGQPDIPTPGKILDAVRNIDMKVLEYSHSAGNESYRRKLVNYYKDNGIEVSFEEILITTGGSEALFFGLFSCLDHEDEVIIPEPFYANYNGFANAGVIKVKPVTSHIEDDFALPPIGEFEKLITSKTKAILICNPSNPTGYLYTEQELEALSKLVKKHDLFLFADEVYREFCYDGREHHSAMNLQDIEQHVVLIDSISKRYSACGARVGALVSKNHDVIQTVLKFSQARLSPPSLAQIAAEAALEVEPEYFKQVNEEYSARRSLVVKRLNEMDGVKCPNPGGAFYVFAQLPVDDSDKFCQWLLEEFSLNDSTVMLAPGTGFYSTPGYGKHEVRLAYVLNKEDLTKALDCLEAGLAAYPGNTLSEATKKQSAY